MILNEKDIARFNRYVDKQIRGCWEWKGEKRKGKTNYYGFLELKGKRYRAHRLAWEIAKGVIPDGLYVLHSCDNSLCVRPSHLFLGTAADNTQDMLAKGRGKGLHGPSGKLNAESVRQIRRLYGSGQLTMRQIGKIYGVSDAMVHHVVHRRWWAHVE